MISQISHVVNIEYNRSARSYEWADPDSGEVFSFPSGPEGKAAAFRFAVQMFAPELYDAAVSIIRKNPQFERRVWRAVNTVLSGGVSIYPDLADTSIIAAVDSSDGMGAYNIRHSDGYRTCECEDFTSMSAPITTSGRRYCYHLLAFELHLRTQEQAY